LNKLVSRYILKLNLNVSSRVEYDYNRRCPCCMGVKPRLEFHKRNIHLRLSGRLLPVCNACQVKLLLKKYIDSNEVGLIAE